MRAKLLLWVCSAYCSLGTICCGQLPPEKALQQIVPADGLRVQLFAAEPRLFASTAMDIDEQGRVWVVEGVNYRQAGGPRIKEPPYFPKPLRSSITLVEASGKRTAIAKTRIEQKKPSDLSLMPQRLVGNLSRQELADLLQFLVEH